MEPTGGSGGAAGTIRRSSGQHAPWQDPMALRTHPTLWQSGSLKGSLRVPDISVECLCSQRRARFPRRWTAPKALNS
ncbi:hypothetical protein R1flu_003005 [Riccia fluitans]|uniref:Uncharacterized protein n=1 Tax=Riccia fluitans TaxID=41844 RepID=A0ABD1Y7S4_9MARC